MLHVLSCNRSAAIHNAQWKNGEEILQAADTRSKRKDISINQPLSCHLLASIEILENLNQSGFDEQHDILIHAKKKNQEHNSTTILKNFHR